MTKRIRSDDKLLLPISSWQEADEHIRRIGTLQQQITEAEFSAKESIDKIRAKLAEEVNDRQEQTKLHIVSIEAFAIEHQADFGGRKSIELNFGVCGWRKSTSISIKENTLELIKQVFTAAKAALYIHKKETVDKEALAKLKDEELATVKARRKEKDVFYVEPAVVEAVDYDKK